MDEGTEGTEGAGASLPSSRRQELSTRLFTRWLPSSLLPLNHKTNTPNHIYNKAKMPARPPPIQSAQHLLLQQEHLVDRILDLVPKRVAKRTFLSLLRTCYPLQHAAAKRLYHTVALENDADIAAFFRGVEVGTPAGSMKCKWLTSKGKRSCEHLTSRPPVTILMPNLLLPPVKNSYEFLYAEARGDKPKGKNGQHAAPATHGPSPDDDPADEWIDVPPSPSPNARNTKAPLLEHVKLLTIGDHHMCSCAHYGPLVAPLLNLQVLRITSNFDNYFQLIPPCDGTASCPLMTGVRATKLVIRNLDGYGLPLPQFNLFFGPWKAELRAPLASCTWPAAEHIDTLVLVFPHHARRYCATNLVRIGQYFPNVPHIKIVFWNQWEGYTDDDYLFAQLHAHVPARAEDMVYPIQQILAHTSAEVTVCGLDDVEWAHDGDLLALLKVLAPDIDLRTLNDASLYKFFETEITTASLFTRKATGAVGTTKNWAARVKFIGAVAYVRDTAARRGELKPTLEEVKPVWNIDGSVVI
ncbi:uncharacterized protein LOC62_01G001550 [Vanrija pseudolonga]|uniref:Uncharacterized protein n=1 Tax=Vanrija pseudolonga TaxID=143232 RepID=A0AAF1BNE1_9TREE|nr:hypothetical protein LOC62_01G001550 [Vanrija pseudolonga]